MQTNILMYIRIPDAIIFGSRCHHPQLLSVCREMQKSFGMIGEDGEKGSHKGGQQDTGTIKGKLINNMKNARKKQKGNLIFHKITFKNIMCVCLKMYACVLSYLSFCVIELFHRVEKSSPRNDGLLKSNPNTSQAYLCLCF